MGLAKQKAKREGMVKVPRRYDIQGKTHYPVFVTAKEMKELKLDGGSGQMTKYGIPAYPPKATHGPDATDKSGRPTSPGTSSTGGSRPGYGTESGRKDRTTKPGTKTTKRDKYRIGYNKNKSLWENIKDINIPGWIKQEWDKLNFDGKPSGDLSDAEKLKAIEGNSDAQRQVMGSMGGPDAGAAAAAAEKEEAYAADRGEDYENKQKLNFLHLLQTVFLMTIIIRYNMNLR